MTTKPIRRRLYREPVTAVQIGELARDIQAQFDELNAAAAVTSVTTNPTGDAGGDLSAQYPNPHVAAIHETSADTKLTIGAIADGDTLIRSGSTLIGSPGAPPGGAAGGDLTGTYPNPQIAPAVITDANVVLANKDGAAGTPSMRTLGSGALQACAGNDSRLSDARTPTGAAGGDLATTYPNPQVAAFHETSGPTKLTFAGISDGNILMRSGTTVVGAPTVGGIWLPDAAPLVPYTDDNEFIDGSGTPTGWSIFDPLSLGYAAAQIYPTFLKCSVPYNATNRLLASYRAAPAASEYSIWAKFSNTMSTGSSGGADDWDMSLVLMEGTTTLTKWAGLSLSYNSSIVARTWATYDATPVNVGPTDPLYVQNVIYVRLGYDGTNFYFYISDDGVGWNLLGSVAKTFTPVKVGFAFTNSKNTGTKFALMDFYRVITGASSSGVDVLANGRVTTSIVGVAPSGGNPTGPAGGDLTGTYPNPTIALLAVTDAKVAAANKDGASSTPSMRTLGSGALQACAGNDSRLSDSRTPTGAAGGDLASTYPNPQVAAIHETAGPTKLTVGSVPDGTFLTRSGTNLIGTNTAGGDLAATYPNPQVAAIHETLGPTKLTIGNIPDGYFLTRSGFNLIGTNAAGGDLAATYPNPQVAAVHETSGPTKLTIGAVGDGQYLTRSGTNIIGTNTAGGDLSATYPNPKVVAIEETGGPTRLAFGAIADHEFLQRSGTTVVGNGHVINPGTNGFRLTGISGVPVMTKSYGYVQFGVPTALTTIYLTPFRGSYIALYNGTNWNLLNSAEVSLAVTGRTTDLPFDIFAYDNSGVVTLEFLNWATISTRATHLIRQDGVWCKTGALTRRYLGSCYPRSATTYHWIRSLVVPLGTSGITYSPPIRFDLFNADNRVGVNFELDGPDGNTTGGQAWRSINGNALYRVDIIAPMPLPEETLNARIDVHTYSPVNNNVTRSAGIGWNTQTSPAASPTTPSSTIGSCNGVCPAQDIRLLHAVLSHIPGVNRFGVDSGGGGGLPDYPCTSYYWMELTGGDMNYTTGAMTGMWTC